MAFDLDCSARNTPDEVVIIDLPPEMQFEAYRKSTNARPVPLEYVHKGMTKVRTVYTPMHDLSVLPAQSFDLVWSGQSLEHVTKEEALAVFKEVARVLKPGGAFCFDTPNRTISSLLTRIGMLHPEHKFEYTYEELEKIVCDSGFKVTRALGETIMPLSGKIGRFCRAEAVHADLVSSDIENGFSVFIECVPVSKL
jgi:ubiquinone/menaquinone biosynthesis C-methylase UbiE